MTVINHEFSIYSSGFDNVIDITSKVKDCIDSCVENGFLNIFLQNSTSSLLILQDEPGIIADVLKYLNQIFPINKIYQHDNLWHNGNGSAHLKAAILPKSISIPIVNSRLLLDENMQIVLLDFDNSVGYKKIFLSVVC